MSNLPEPSKEPTKNLHGLSIEYYKVGSWCPTQDATGPATAVVLEFKIKGISVSFFLRLNTRDAVDTMIASLERHRDDVFNS